MGWWLEWVVDDGLDGGGSGGGGGAVQAVPAITPVTGFCSSSFLWTDVTCRWWCRWQAAVVDGGTNNRRFPAACGHAGDGSRWRQSRRFNREGGEAVSGLDPVKHGQGRDFTRKV
jgi:hypothetical protein